MIRRPFLRPVAAVLGAVCLLNGCHQWKPMSATALNERPVSSARVRMSDGRQVVLVQPRVVGDSLVGRVDSVEPGPASLPSLTVSTREAVALADVRSVEVRQVDVVRSAGATLVGLLVLVLGLGLMCQYSGCFVAQ